MNDNHAKPSAKVGDFPVSSPQITPQPGIGYGHPEYHFVQSIMEMQKSLGEINANIKSLEKSIDSTKASLEKSIDSTKSKVEDLIGWKNKIWGGAITLGVVFGLINFILIKSWDYVSFKAPTQPQQIIPAPQTIQPNQPPHKRN